MEKITVTTYRGLSQVSGSISLPKLFEHMRGEIYRDRVRRIREALTSGDTGKADRMKKQLPYRTITATYSNERLAYSLETYQDIITLDFDDMEVEKIPEYRRLANDCPDTLGNFISPREHGLKIFVYLTGEEPEALRAELNALGTIDLPTLERYHHRMFALAADKYQKLLNTKVDTSGSDLSRGVFVSHDPDAFLSLERLENVKPLTVTLTLPTEEECKKKKRKKPLSLPSLLPAQENATPIRPASAARLPQSCGIHQTERTPRTRQPRQLLLLPRQPVLPPPHHGSGSRRPDTQLFRQPSRLRLRTASLQCLPIHLEDGSGRRGF